MVSLGDADMCGWTRGCCGRGPVVAPAAFSWTVPLLCFAGPPCDVFWPAPAGVQVLMKQASAGRLDITGMAHGGH